AGFEDDARRVAPAEHRLGVARLEVRMAVGEPEGLFHRFDLSECDLCTVARWVSLVRGSSPRNRPVPRIGRGRLPLDKPHRNPYMGYTFVGVIADRSSRPR